MRQKAKELIKHPLVSGTSTVFLGSLFVNIINFVFNFFMLHELPVTDYGILATIVSIIGFPTLVIGALGMVVIRFAGNYFATGQLDKAKALYVKIFKLLLVISLIFSITYLILLPQIANFFHIQNMKILFLTDVIIFLCLISIINTSFLQAKLAFTFQAINNALAAIIKLALGVAFVLLGFSVNGVVVSILFSVAVTYAISFLPLKSIFNERLGTLKLSKKEFIAYGIPSGATIFGLTSFISSDIILAKHFFNPTNAGIYAGLSLVSRVIFYFSAPIGTVMYPILVQKYAKNEKIFGTFFLSLFLVLLPSIAITLFYFLFPSVPILIFSKKEYLVGAPYLGIFGLFITFYSLLTVLAYFYLAIHKTIIVFPIVIGAIMQIILIFMFHQSYQQIINISLIITFLLTVVLLLYYPYAKKN